MLPHTVRGDLDRTEFKVLGTMSCELLETKNEILASLLKWMSKTCGG